MKDDRIDIRIDSKVKKAFIKEVGQRNVTHEITDFIKKRLKRKKGNDDHNSTHLFI